MCVSLIASPLPGRFSRRKTQTYRPRVVLCWPFAGKGYQACLPSLTHTRGQVCKCVCVAAALPLARCGELGSAVSATIS